MIELTHIGDTLIAEMLNSSTKVQELFSERLGEPFIDKDDITAVPDVSLVRCGGCVFDDAHRVDVGLLRHGTLKCLPIEAKLGADRLAKVDFDKRFLQPCGTSNGGTKISGSMISILERKLPAALGEEIDVFRDGVTYKLTPAWILVVREKVLASWDGPAAPNLSANCKVISIESIVAAYGDKNDFNSLVTRLLSADYHKQWFGA